MEIVIAGIVSVLMLTVMELVLGVDNVIFIGIVADTMPDKRKADLARKIGLVLALVVRCAMLSSITYLAHMTEPILTILSVTEWWSITHLVTIRDLVLLAGGILLIYKTSSELHEEFLPDDDQKEESSSGAKFAMVIAQIVVIDFVFSFDSILTAVGLVSEVSYMIIAVLISMGIMFFYAGKIADFINRKPTLKLMALMFLLMIGSMLIGEGLGFEIQKGYVYASMAFALLMEALNNYRVIKKSKKRKAIRKKMEV